MNKKDTTPPKNDASHEIMLAHYQLIHQRYLYERVVGERLLNVFLTLATAIVGGLLLFTTNDKQISNLPIILIAGLSFLFLLGLGTFDLVRVRTMDCLSWLAKANLAQQYFFEKDKRLSKYLQPYNIKEISESWFQSLMLSGLLRTVAILNTFIAIALSIVIGNAVLKISTEQITWLAIAVGIVIWALHVISRRRGMKKA